MIKATLMSTWKGKPFSELTRDELIEALEWAGDEIRRLDKENARYMNAVDMRKLVAQEAR